MRLASRDDVTVAVTASSPLAPPPQAGDGWRFGQVSRASPTPI